MHIFVKNIILRNVLKSQIVCLCIDRPEVFDCDDVVTFLISLSYAAMSIIQEDYHAHRQVMT